MKKICLLLIFAGITVSAQIKGNKKLETRSFNLEEVKHIKINLYAKIIIDQSLEEGMTITTDSNLFDLMEKEVLNNTLHLEQVEWIQPSQKAIISIGAPNLEKVSSGTHGVTKIININSDKLQISAPVGRVILNGKTQELIMEVKLGDVDASELVAENAMVKIDSWGSAKVNVVNVLNADISNGGRLAYLDLPETLNTRTQKDGRVVHVDNAEELKNPEAKYISFKIKNNSINRNHFKVIGPKPDGSRFGYGFPMMPLSTRSERWTVGTKVYRVNSLGFQKLLITIKEEDEHKTVDLF